MRLKHKRHYTKKGSVFQTACSILCRTKFETDLMQYKNPRCDRLNHQSSLRFLKTRTRKWKREICNWVSKMIRDCITFAFLRSVIGPENSCHSFDQSDAKLTPTVVCVACDFPRFRKFGRFYYEFPLAPKGIFLCSNWPLWLLWFWFYDTRSKSAIFQHGHATYFKWWANKSTKKPEQETYEVISLTSS